MIWSTESIYKLFVTCSVLVVNTSYELITGFRVTGPILCDIMICTYIVSSIHLLLIKQRGLCLSSRTCASKVVRLKVQIFPPLSLSCRWNKLNDLTPIQRLTIPLCVIQRNTDTKLVKSYLTHLFIWNLLSSCYEIYRNSSQQFIYL